MTEHDPLDLDHPIDLPQFMTNGSHEQKKADMRERVMRIPLPVEAAVQAASLGIERMPEAPIEADVIQRVAQRIGDNGHATHHGAVTQAIKETMRELGINWKLLQPYQKEALETIATKIGRILAGDIEIEKNWADIAEVATMTQHYMAASK